MSKKAMILTILIASWLLNASSVSAICALEDVSTHINRATAIFAGKVTNIEDNGNTTFEVSQVWKGSMNKILTINQINGSAAANGTRVWVEDMPTFELNKEYLVYLVGNEPSGCGSTKLLADAQGDLSILGQGKTIDQNNKISTDHPASSTNRTSLFDKFNISQGLLIINTILLLIVIFLLINKTKNEKS